MNVKFTIVTSCALLTRDLLAIAKFLVINTEGHIIYKTLVSIIHYMNVTRQ